MANQIILKKSSVAGKVPLATDLAVGEIAVNLADQKLYSKNAGGTVIQLGGGANGNALTTNDGYDRGTLLTYYTTAQGNAFMGWDTSNAEFALASNVTLNDNVVTIIQAKYRGATSNNEDDKNIIIQFNHIRVKYKLVYSTVLCCCV